MTEPATVTRPAPRIDHPAELTRIIRQIVARADPEAIYLFGSRARGDARPDSDYDLMVVVPDQYPADAINSAVAYQLVEGRHIAIDVVMVSASRFRRRSRLVGTLSFEVTAEGVRLHGR